MNQLTTLSVIRADLQRVWNYLDSPESNTMCLLIALALVAWVVCMFINSITYR